jgi:photosystem II stability/assembly factor-like uncharacterized protein
LLKNLFFMKNLFLFLFLWFNYFCAIAQWRPVINLDVAEIYCYASSDSTVYFGTPNGIFSSSDDGKSWFLLKSTEGIPVEVLFFKDKRIYAYMGAKFQVSQDFGLTWSLLIDYHISNFYDSMTVIEGNDLLVLDYGELTNFNLKTNTITKISTDDLQKDGTSFAGIHRKENIIYIALNKKILKTSDNGKTWTKVVNDDYYEKVIFQDSLIVYSSYSGGLRYSTNLGKSWEQSKIYQNDFFVDGDKIYALLDTALLSFNFKSKGNWIKEKISKDFFDTTKTVLSIEKGRLISKSEYNERHYVSEKNNFLNHNQAKKGLNAIAIRNISTIKDNILINTFFNSCIISQDNAKTWNLLTHDKDSLFYIGLNTKKLIIGYTRYNIVFSIDEGNTWKNIDIPDDNNIKGAIDYNLIISPLDQDNQIRISNNFGKTWVKKDLPFPEWKSHSLYFTQKRIFLTVEEKDIFKILFSNDLGDNWTEIYEGIYPLFSVIEEAEDFYINLGIQTMRYNILSNSSIISPNSFQKEVLLFSNVLKWNNYYFAKALKDNIYISKNKGKTWEIFSDIYYGSKGSWIHIAGDYLYTYGYYKTLFRYPLAEILSTDSSPANDSELVIYPNPSSSILHIKALNNDLKDCKIEVYDFMGKKVITLTNQENIDIQSLPNAVYILKIRLKDKYWIKKFEKN